MADDENDVAGKILQEKRVTVKDLVSLAEGGGSTARGRCQS
jgi:hypothetical protein